MGQKYQLKFISTFNSHKNSWEKIIFNEPIQCLNKHNFYYCIKLDSDSKNCPMIIRVQTFVAKIIVSWICWASVHLTTKTCNISVCFCHDGTEEMNVLNVHTFYNCQVKHDNQVLFLGLITFFTWRRWGRT